MNRTAAHELIASSANRLARQIFASLSYRQKLSSVFEKLADALTDGFAVTVYAAALYYGSEGLPEIKGEPAANYGPKEGETFSSFVKRVTRNPALRGYGKKFGEQYYHFCRARMGDSGAADFLMKVVSEVLDTSSSLHGLIKKSGIHGIEQALYVKAKNFFKDETKSKIRRKTDGMPLDEEGSEVDLPDRDLDPDHLPTKLVLKKLDRALDDPEIRKDVEEAAKKLSPDLDEYFRLLMDGFEPREIYNLRLLPSMQKNLPPELRLDATKPNPFDSGIAKQEPGLSGKQQEMKFREELAKYPNPLYSNPTTFLKNHTDLMKALQEALSD